MFENLAKALKLLLMKADRVLDNPPYNLVVHTSPRRIRRTSITTGTSNSWRS